MIQWLMMGEKFRYDLAISTAEVMYALLEAEYQREECDLNALMRRLKDLSVYSLTHAEIMEQREGAVGRGHVLRSNKQSQVS